MRIIKRTARDADVLRSLVEADRIVKAGDQPKDYAGLVVLKPWGYEFQVYNGTCAIWLACLRPGHAVSMHCHLRKKAMFLPLAKTLRLVTLAGRETLLEAVTVEEGVFHSQENVGDKDAFFLEYETSPEKTDIIRYRDRYGREHSGYEGRSEMVPFADAPIEWGKLPDQIKVMMGMAA